MQECVDIRRHSLPEGHHLIARAENALGESIARQGRFAEAEPLLVGSVNRISEAYSPKHARTIEALTRIADLYTSWGKPELAATWRGRLPDSYSDP